jgi:hypothetical protein
VRDPLSFSRHSSLATALPICGKLAPWSVKLRRCSSPSPVLTGARESAFPQRSPITPASLVSHVWGRGRIRRSTPSWRATSR